MLFGPANDQLFLSSRNPAGEGYNRGNPINRFIIVVPGMKMRVMVRSARFRVHCNHNPKESAELGHKKVLPEPGRILPQRTVPLTSETNSKSTDLLRCNSGLSRNVFFDQLSILSNSAIATYDAEKSTNANN